MVLSHPRYDEEAWNSYPGLRHLFNKLELALKLEYNAGPSLVPVPKSGRYIIRPIYNLGGMGSYAHIAELKKGETVNIPGSFWCEEFKGRHISIEYARHKQEIFPQWACEGFRSGSELFRFSKWVKLEELPQVEIPAWLERDLSHAWHSNIEFIGDKIIEVHLRRMHDFPAGAKEIIPIWDDQDITEQHITWSDAGYTFTEAEDSNDGNLPAKRLGFYYR